MKKYFNILVLVIASLFVFTTGVSAKSAVTNLVEAVEEEIGYFGNKQNFEDETTFLAYQEFVDKLKAADLSNYSESDDKVNVYIFRGKSCWHCLDEITWLASNYAEFKDVINVHTYEVWNNRENNKLMNLVAKELGKKASGVPFTVVGNETFSGFSEEVGSAIIEAAKQQKNSEDRYDIKNVINLDEVSAGEKKSNVIMIILILVVLAGGIVFIYFISKSK
ncbi:MAG: hypothetical protein E7159_03325 [Firmicutes bacterium]|jgi:hypothetical protein|nr:hypothetical protein [Bacillota bacterium]